jgi:hypothetical protein
MQDSENIHKEATSARVGPLFAVIIIILLLSIGGIYYLVTQEQHLRATHTAEQFNS